MATANKNDNYIESVEALVRTTENLLIDKGGIALFRGQTRNWSLLPKVTRKDPKKDTTDSERKAVQEYRRRLARERDIAAMQPWDLLVFAQHYGLATRLLDWTTNPLFALWFACFGGDDSHDSYVYLFFAKDSMLLDTSAHPDPFSLKETTVLRPNYNNSRIRAQSGWFTAHVYSSDGGQFLEVGKDKAIGANVLMKGVRKESKKKILEALDRLGVNQETVFPGPEGTANHVNWLHRDDF